MIGVYYNFKQVTVDLRKRVFMWVSIEITLAMQF